MKNNRIIELKNRMIILCLIILAQTQAFRLNFAQIGYSEWISKDGAKNKEVFTTLPSVQLYFSHLGWEYYSGLPFIRSEGFTQSHSSLGDLDFNLGRTLLGSYLDRYQKIQLKLKIGTKIPTYNPLPLKREGDPYIGSGNISPYIQTQISLPLKWTSNLVGVGVFSQIKWASPLSFRDKLLSTESWDTFTSIKASYDKFRFAKISIESILMYADYYWTTVDISEKNTTVALASSISIPLHKRWGLAGQLGHSIYTSNNQESLVTNFSEEKSALFYSLNLQWTP